MKLRHSASFLCSSQIKSLTVYLFWTLKADAALDYLLVFLQFLLKLWHDRTLFLCLNTCSLSLSSFHFFHCSLLLEPEEEISSSKSQKRNVDTVFASRTEKEHESPLPFPFKLHLSLHKGPSIRLQLGLYFLMWPLHLLRCFLHFRQSLLGILQGIWSKRLIFSKFLNLPRVDSQLQNFRIRNECTRTPTDRAN